MRAFAQYVLSSDALYDSEPFVQFKKREKHPWKSVTFSKNPGSILQRY